MSRDPYALSRCAHGHVHDLEQLRAHVHATQELSAERGRRERIAKVTKEGLRRRDRVSRAGLRERVRLEDEWETVLGALSGEALLDAVDVEGGYQAATWTIRKRASWMGLRKSEGLPNGVSPAHVSRMLRAYADAPDQLKPVVEAQIYAATGMSPAEANRAMLVSLAEYRIPSPQQVQEALSSHFGAEFWMTNGVQLYLQMAMQTSAAAGTTALQHLGLNRTWAWAHPQSMSRDLFQVRGSKVIQALYGAHVEKLQKLIVEATNPRNPLTLQQVQARIRAEWPKLKAAQIATIARTETAVLWTHTSMNAYAANGIEQWESTVAHGPSIGVESEDPCPECVAEALQVHGIDSDWPPWHPNCRCEAVPVFENEEGEVWLPPDEPFTGGADAIENAAVVEFGDDAASYGASTSGPIISPAPLPGAPIAMHPSRFPSTAPYRLPARSGQRVSSHTPEDDIRAMITSCNNKISGLKTRLKRETDPSKVNEINVRLNEQLRLRSELKERLRTGDLSPPPPPPPQPPPPPPPPPPPARTLDELRAELTSIGNRLSGQRSRRARAVQEGNSLKVYEIDKRIAALLEERAGVQRAIKELQAGRPPPTPLLGRPALPTEPPVGGVRTEGAIYLEQGPGSSQIADDLAIMRKEILDLLFTPGAPVSQVDDAMRAVIRAGERVESELQGAPKALRDKLEDANDLVLDLQIQSKREWNEMGAIESEYTRRNGNAMVRAAEERGTYLDTMPWQDRQAMQQEVWAKNPDIVKLKDDLTAQREAYYRASRLQTEATTARTEIEEQIFVAQRKEIQEVLGKVRDIGKRADAQMRYEIRVGSETKIYGNNGKLKGRNLSKAKKLIEKSLEFMPSSWIRAQRVADVGMVRRGWHGDRSTWQELRISADSRGKAGDEAGVPTAIHELAHEVEDTVRGVLSVERSFYRHRTAGEELQPLSRLTNVRYGRDEVARPDKFSDAYMGKSYPNGQSYEIVTMGMESLWTGSHALDAEYRQFILGLLAIL